MLKQFTALLLSVLLLVSTIGVQVSKHYCRNLLVSTDIGGGIRSCCNEESGEQSKCCHNHSKYYQLDTDYVLNVLLQLQHSVVTMHPEPGIPFCEFVFIDPKDEPIVFKDLPPPKLKVRLSKLQAYLI